MDDGRDSDPDREENNDTFYINIMERTIETFSLLLGEKTAFMAARKSPITMTADGSVTGYYGTGKQAFDVLVQQYETVFGKGMADRKIRNALRDLISENEKDYLPERVQPEDKPEKIGILEQLQRMLPFSAVSSL